MFICIASLPHCRHRIMTGRSGHDILRQCHDSPAPSPPRRRRSRHPRAARRLSAAYLQRSGFRVSEAKNAAEARKIMAGSAIELVILDIMMPGEDGLSLCRSIREQGEMPVILLTARSEETDRIVGLEMGRGRLCAEALLAAASWSRASRRSCGAPAAPACGGEQRGGRLSLRGLDAAWRRLDADRVRWRRHSPVHRRLPPPPGVRHPSAPGAEPRPVARPDPGPRGACLRPLDR